MMSDKLSPRKRSAIAILIMVTIIMFGVIYIKKPTYITSGDETIIPSVNGETTGDTKKLWKGESYHPHLQSFTYGGSEIRAGTSTFTHSQYFFNVWRSYESGSGRIYFKEGDMIYLDRLYKVQKVTDDYVILERK